MRVLVTGAFGYLGGRIAEDLAGRGHEVVLSGRRVPAALTAWADRFEVRLCDLLSARSLRQTVRSVDAVVHLASLDENEAERDPEAALRVSGVATRQLLDAARAEKVGRFVFFSTFHVYGATGDRVIDEDSPTRAAHPYSIAHLTGEGFCREARARHRDAVAIARLSNGYGAPTYVDVDRWTLAHNDFCRQAVRDRRVVLKSPGLQHRDFVSITDVAHATARLLECSADDLGEGVFNVGGDCSRSVLSVAQLVCDRASALLGTTVAIERPEGGSEMPPVRFSIERMRSLGYQPTDRMRDETDRLLAMLAGAK